MKAVRTNGGMELKRGVNNRTGISADLFGVYVYEKITHTFAHCLQKTVYHFVQKEESGEITQNFLAMSGGGDLYCDSDRAYARIPWVSRASGLHPAKQICYFGGWRFPSD